MTTQIKQHIKNCAKRYLGLEPYESKAYTMLFVSDHAELSVQPCTVFDGNYRIKYEGFEITWHVIFEAMLPDTADKIESLFMAYATEKH